MNILLSVTFSPKFDLCWSPVSVIIGELFASAEVLSWHVLRGCLNKTFEAQYSDIFCEARQSYISSVSLNCFQGYRSLF